MKYKTLLITILLAVVNVAFASGNKTISQQELPSHARFFLRTEFPKSEIQSVSIIEDNVYEVLTTDDSKFNFDEKGNWLNLECPQIGVPSFVIPQKIQTALRKNCGSNAKVIQLKKLSRGRYDVELANGFGLRFDKKMEIIDVRERAFMARAK